MSALCLAAASIAALYALGFAISRPRPYLAPALCGLLGCIAFILAADAFRYARDPLALGPPRPWLGALALCGAMIWRLCSLLGGLEEEPRPRRLLVFLPLVPAIASDILVHGFSLAERGDPRGRALVLALHLATGAWVLASCAVSAFRLLRASSPKSMGPAPRLVLGISASGAVALLAGLAGLFSGAGILYALMDGFVAAAVTAGALLRFRWPGALEEFRDQAITKRYRRSTLEGLDAEGLIAGMEAMMRKTGYCFDPDCSLEGLSRRMGLTRHQTSELLNLNLGRSFSSYVNGFRIERAMALLLERPELGVLAVACEVGFGNKTSFNEAFLKLSGLSPSAFRKRASGKAAGAGAQKASG